MASLVGKVTPAGSLTVITDSGFATLVTALGAFTRASRGTYQYAITDGSTITTIVASFLPIQYTESEWTINIIVAAGNTSLTLLVFRDGVISDFEVNGILTLHAVA